MSSANEPIQPVAPKRPPVLSEEDARRDVEMRLRFVPWRNAAQKERAVSEMARLVVRRAEDAAFEARLAERRGRQ